MKTFPNSFTPNTATLQIAIGVAGLMAVGAAFAIDWVGIGGDSEFGAKQLIIVYAGIALLCVSVLSWGIDHFDDSKSYALTPAAARRLEWVIAVVLFVTLTLTGFFLQKPLSLNDGHGWEGLYHYEIFEAYLGGQPLATTQPFAVQPALPVVVAELFPDDIIFGFLVANIVANALTTILFVVWLRLYIQSAFIRIVVLTLFMVAWHSPVRHVFYEPVSVEHWLYAFLLAGFIGIAKVDLWPRALTVLYMCVVTFVGVLFRDYAIIPAVALLFTQNSIPSVQQEAKFAYLRARLPSPLLALPLICGVVALYLSQMVISDNGLYSPLTTAISMLFTKTLPMYLLAWFVAFGPVVALIAFDWKQTLQFLFAHQPFLVALILFALLAYLGGAGTVVMLHWSAPLVFLLIGLTIERHQRLFAGSTLLLALLVICQIFSQRVFWLIPDYPNEAPRLLPLFTIPGNHVRFMDVVGMGTDYPILFMALMQYLLLAAAIIFSLRRQDAEIGKSTSRPQQPMG